MRDSYSSYQYWKLTAEIALYPRGCAQSIRNWWLSCYMCTCMYTTGTSYYGHSMPELFGNENLINISFSIDMGIILLCLINSSHLLWNWLPSDWCTQGETCYNVICKYSGMITWLPAQKTNWHSISLSISHSVHTSSSPPPLKSACWHS